MHRQVIRILGESNHHPDTLHMMVTSRCSLNCKGCFYRTRKHSELSFPQAVDIARQAAELGVKWLAIGGGEPLEWECLRDFISEARDICDLKVAVTTNGTKCESIQPNRVHISHDCMHSNHSWEDRERQVRDALSYYASEPSIEGLGINTMLGDSDKISTDLLQTIDCITVVLPKPFSNPGRGWKTKTLRELRRLSEYTSVAVDSCLAVALGETCNQGRNSLSVNSDGYYSSCSNISYSPRQMSLEHAWEFIRRRAAELPTGCIMKGVETIE